MRQFTRPLRCVEGPQEPSLQPQPLSRCARPSNGTCCAMVCRSVSTVALSIGPGTPISATSYALVTCRRGIRRRLAVLHSPPIRCQAGPTSRQCCVLRCCLAIWPGQGSYYGALVFAVWTCSRAIAIQPRATVMHLGVPLLMGVGLNAAGVLPRLELQALSNLADGYPATDLVGGWQLADFERLITPGPWALGITTMGLCAVGLLGLARRPRAPFVLATVLWATGLALAIPIETPLHSLLFHVLPGFGPDPPACLRARAYRDVLRASIVGWSWFSGHYPALGDSIDCWLDRRRIGRRAPIHRPLCNRRPGRRSMGRAHARTELLGRIRAHVRGTISPGPAAFARQSISFFRLRAVRRWATGAVHTSIR